MSLRDFHVPLSQQGKDETPSAPFNGFERATAADAAPIDTTPAPAASAASIPTPQTIPCSPACRLPPELIPQGSVLPPFDGDLSATK